MITYHFVKGTLRDGRPVPADGEWLEHKGSLVMCESGLHASAHPFDALRYAPGATLCLVELDGEIIDGGGRRQGHRAEAQDHQACGHDRSVESLRPPVRVGRRAPVELPTRRSPISGDRGRVASRRSTGGGGGGGDVGHGVGQI